MAKTIAKGLNLIETLAENKDPCSVSELARLLRSPKSSVHFLLRALSERGYVEQEPDTKRYFLTLRLWEIGTRVLGRFELRRIASPYLASLAETTSETVNLAILDHGEVVYIDKIDSALPVRAYIPVGGRAPVYCTATGKAMLAYQAEDVILKLTASMKPYTDKSARNAVELRKELKRVRDVGYAFNRGESEDSVRGVAAPIWDSSGRVVAAIGVYGPAARLPPKKLNSLANAVKAASVTISVALGHRKLPR